VKTVLKAVRTAVSAKDRITVRRATTRPACASMPRSMQRLHKRISGRRAHRDDRIRDVDLKGLVDSSSGAVETCA
jgi:hypothetical protein